MASPQYDMLEEAGEDVALNNPNIVEIPVAGGEVVTLDLLNDISDDPFEICVLLENEKTEHNIWLAIAVSTFSQAISREQFLLTIL